MAFFKLVREKYIQAVTRCFGFSGFTCRLHSPSQYGELERFIFCDFEKNEMEQNRIAEK